MFRQETVALGIGALVSKESIIPLFGFGNTSKSLNVSAQRRVNLYYEVQPDEDKSKVTIYNTPGLVSFAIIGAATVRGMRAMGDYIYAVQNNKLYSIDNAGTIVSRGTLSTSSGRVDMSDNGTQLIIVDGTAGYTYTPGTTTFATISDGNFQNGCTTVTYLDSYFIVEKANSQQFYLSEIADGTDWTPVTFSSADAAPDNLTRVFADHGILYLFGSTTTEMWANNATGSFTYSRIGSTTLEWGLGAKWSLAKFDRGLVFLGVSRLGEMQVMQVAGTEIKRISNSEVENALNTYDSVSAATGFSYLIDGHPFYQINFTASNKSWLYDGSTGAWSELTTNYGRHAAEMCVQFLGKPYVADYSTGTIYRLDKNTYTDNGTPIIRRLIGRHTFLNLERLTCWQVQFDFEPGVGLITGQGETPQAMLRVSTDGGHTYGPERWTTIGAIGNYLTRAVWPRCGRARDFIFDLTISDPVKIVICNAAGRFSK
jgi:hypothetical protein